MALVLGNEAFLIERVLTLTSQEGGHLIFIFESDFFFSKLLISAPFFLMVKADKQCMLNRPHSRVHNLAHTSL